MTGSGRRYTAVAIDGPAASGKSTTAMEVARVLGFRHVDSGALYRAATAAAFESAPFRAPDDWDEDYVLEAARSVSMRAAEHGYRVFVDGRDAELASRSPDVTARVSRVASMQRVRDWVNAQVRRAAEESDVVVDGRDIGTTVFPDATVKVFLTADARERAIRRLRQRDGREPGTADVEDETQKILLRDEMDAAQSAPAADAVTIDTTNLTQGEQVQKIIALVRERAAR